MEWNSTTQQKGTNGQSISECLFDVINFPKDQQKIWQISALEHTKADYNDLINDIIKIMCKLYQIL